MLQKNDILNLFEFISNPKISLKGEILMKKLIMKTILAAGIAAIAMPVTAKT